MHFVRCPRSGGRPRTYQPQATLWVRDQSRRAWPWVGVSAHLGCSVRLTVTLGLTFWLSVSHAEELDAEAQFRQGRAHLRGDEVEHNERRAFELFLSAAEKGHLKAMNNLGLMYAQGRGGVQDTALGAKWLRKAAESGVAVAQDNLGLMLASGSAGTKDIKEAEMWYRKAAAQDHAEAQRHLGELYYFGVQEIAQDYPEAGKWISKAAAQGNAAAQNTLGVMCEHGLGMLADLAAAARWYQKAADQGDAKAQSSMGRLYAFGTGVERSPVKAYQWLKLGVDRGDAAAWNLLNEVQQGMSADEIKEAQGLADRFLKDRLNHPAVTVPR